MKPDWRADKPSGKQKERKSTGEKKGKSPNRK